MHLASFSQFLFSGLVLGCIYALVALGFVILANVTGVLNFATGEYVMLGGMLTSVMAARHWSLWLAVPLAVFAVAAIGTAQERLTLAPVRRANVITLVIITFGVSAVLRGVALLIWGANSRSVPAFTSSGSFSFLGARLEWQSVWVALFTAALLGVFYLFFTRTMTGRAMRACSDNPAAARLMGVRLSRMSMLAFALSAGAAALGGAVIAPITHVTYDIGLSLGLTGFVAALIAGFTNPVVAVVAALGLGAADSLGAGYISSAWKDAITFLILLAYLFAQDLGLIAPPGRQMERLRAAFREFAPRARFAALGERRRARGRRAAFAAEFVPVPAAAPPAEAPAWRRWLWLPIAVALIVLFPQLFTGSYPRGLAIVAGIEAIGAVGLVLLIGYAGQLNLGFAGWLLIGGYTSAILTAKYGWNPTAALAVAVVASGVSAYVIAKLALRFEGFQLAIATLAVQVLLAVVVLQETRWTGGAVGVVGIPAFRLFAWQFGSVVKFYYLVWGTVLLCTLVGLNIDRSRAGRALRAIGTGEPAAESLGVDSGRYKLQMFVVSSLMAGIAGSFYAHYLRYINPQTYNFNLTVAIITFAVVGGLTTVWGGAVGAIAVTVVQELVREVGTRAGGTQTPVYQVIVIGALLVVMLIIAPEGLVPRAQGAFVWARGRLRGAPRTPVDATATAEAGSAERVPAASSASQR